MELPCGPVKVGGVPWYVSLSPRRQGRERVEEGDEPRRFVARCPLLRPGIENTTRNDEGPLVLPGLLHHVLTGQSARQNSALESLVAISRPHLSRPVPKSATAFLHLRLQHHRKPCPQQYAFCTPFHCFTRNTITYAGGTTSDALHRLAPPSPGATAFRVQHSAGRSAYVCPGGLDYYKRQASERTLALPMSRGLRATLDLSSLVGVTAPVRVGPFTTVKVSSLTARSCLRLSTCLRARQRSVGLASCRVGSPVVPLPLPPPSPSPATTSSGDVAGPLFPFSRTAWEAATTASCEEGTSASATPLIFCSACKWLAVRQEENLCSLGRRFPPGPPRSQQGHRIEPPSTPDHLLFAS
ncbi:unnamed protein product [Trichogramma brassicae]|uniref:Uncharacterized protein n=1 Tax=Trichogramma brassicae TaxID=86971 RepID=A0A6H5HY24_9HYME|nr:unnamed protein product [Trichogramma brassicae]